MPIGGEIRNPSDLTETISINDLSDVDTTGVSTGDFLQKSAGDWVDFDLFGTANTWTADQTISEDNKLIFRGVTTTIHSSGAGELAYTASGINAKHRWLISTTEAMTITSSGIVINEDGSSALDFRAETENDPNALFVDASADEVSTGAVATMNIKGEAKGQSMTIGLGFHAINSGVTLVLRPQSNILSGNSDARGVPVAKAGSILSIAVNYDLNSNVGEEDVVFTVRKNSGSGWTDLLSVTDTAPTAADGIILGATATRATGHDFSAGDVIGVKRVGDGTLETDDMFVLVELVFDT